MTISFSWTKKFGSSIHTRSTCVRANGTVGDGEGNGAASHANSSPISVSARTARRAGRATEPEFSGRLGSNATRKAARRRARLAFMRSVSTRFVFSASELPNPNDYELGHD